MSDDGGAPGLRGSHVLSAITAGALLATLALGFFLPRRAVRQAEDEILLAEAGIAQQLLVESGDPAVVTGVLGDRWRAIELPAGSEGSADASLESELLGQPVLVDGPDGRVARAARYAPDRWTVIGAVEVGPGEYAGAGFPLWLWLLALSSAGTLVLTAGGWVRRGERDDVRATALPALFALAVLGIPLMGAGAWAEDRLDALTDLRLRRGVEVLAALPEPDAVIERPGGVAQLTGLSFLVRADHGASFSTFLPATTAALAALDAPAAGEAGGGPAVESGPEPGTDPGPSVRAPDAPRVVRTAVGRTPWAVAGWGSVVVARVPYDHTRSPWGTLLGVALAGLALAWIPVTLAPLVAGGRRRRRELRRNLVAWGFLSPAAIHLAIFTFGPLAFALWLSLHEWSLVDPARPFVGLGNYLGLLGDGEFWNAMANTAVFTLHVPVAMAVALAFALLVHRRAGAGRAVTAVRAVLFLPTITSLVAVAMVWQWMLNDHYGLLNWVLSSLGLGTVPWLSSPKTALAALILMGVWLVVGYQMVLFLAGLAAIPEDLYDAARIDGAGPWRRFLHVTLPGLRHTLFFVLVTSVIGSFQVFGAVYVMTEGGPLGSTDVAVYHIYQEAWEFLRFGNAAAMSWILFALIFGVTWLHFRLLERRAEAPA